MAREYTKEAQQELMEKSLRNVRGLVDKVEGQDLADKRAERRLLKRLAVGVFVLFAIFAGLFAYISANQSGKTITIEQKR